MSKKAFDKISEGLAEALAIARGEVRPARLYVPPEMDVKAIRENLGFAQDHFAAAFGFTVHQVRQWEQGRVRPTGAVRAYLMLIQNAPDKIRAMLLDAQKKQKSAA